MIVENGHACTSHTRPPPSPPPGEEIAQTRYLQAVCECSTAMNQIRLRMQVFSARPGDKQGQGRVGGGRSG